MPAPVISPSSTRAVPPRKLRATSVPPKKRRLVRRRGRGRGELESDDEIEREVATDSDSDDEDLSSLDSATDDSDTEPPSEDVVPHDRAHLPTPRNSKSPETVVKEEVAQVNRGVPSFFAPSGDWSEMVMDENANGPADLPVIEFADFTASPPSQTAPSHKPKKVSSLNHSIESRAIPTQLPASEDPPPVVEVADPSTSEPRPSAPKQLSLQSARQAYQHKLETDPSFVPTIGNFWGHDDRLIDTELRSLSGWWRGRGRGRGRGLGMRGGLQRHHSLGANEPEALIKDEDLPPIERAWTHDGFEDMKRKEDQRRADQQATRKSQASPKYTGSNGNRGGFVPARGRGGFVRGGFVPPVRLRTQSPFNIPGRVRFHMKPELMWTKQHEAFLYFDPTLKIRSGQGPSYRIKVAGHKLEVVMASSLPSATSRIPTPKVTNDGSSEVGDKSFVVRLPRRAGKEREVNNDERFENISAKETRGVVPQLTAQTIPVVEETPLPNEVAKVAIPAQPSLSDLQAVPEPHIRSQGDAPLLETERQTNTEQIAIQPTAQTNGSAISRPVLPSLQTAFSPPPPLPHQPVSHNSPAHASMYEYYSQLPPGIGMNLYSVPYEMATGHPVYLQPPTMYNPRPLGPTDYNPNMPILQGHVHHHSAVSPDFLQHPSSQTPPMNGFVDPATGTPIFSFPRQTTRIEIRAPTEETGKTKVSSSSRTSSLRTTAPTFQPSRLAETSSSTGNSENGYYHQPSSSEVSAYDNKSPHASVDDANQINMAGLMPYPYHQSYYYPEPYGYQYVDMSQGAQYDMYNVDQPPQGTVYY